MKPRSSVLILLVLIASCLACGATAREKTLKAAFIATQSAQAGFEAWDAQHQLDVANAATSVADGVEKLGAYRESRAAVVLAFESAYRALAAAAILKEGGLAGVAAAAEQLELALKTVTKGKLP